MENLPFRGDGDTANAVPVLLSAISDGDDRILEGLIAVNRCVTQTKEPRLDQRTVASVRLGGLQ
jgi:hypothetical protein